MAGRPQTLYGLADSPIGLAAWMLDHDAASQALIARVFAGAHEGLTRDDILDNVTLYWLTNTAVSSARLYWESKLAFFAPKGVTLPTAVSAFPDEIYTAPRELGREGLSEPHPLQPARRKAGTSPPGSSRTRSSARCARRSGRCAAASWSPGNAFDVRQADRRRCTRRRLCRRRPAGRPRRAAPARLALRHPRLRRGHADAWRRGYRVIVPYLRGYGTTRFLSTDTVRNGEQAALAMDAIALMDALQIDRAIVAGFDWGARTAASWPRSGPERCTALVAVSGYLIGSQANSGRSAGGRAAVVVPVLLRTERGRPATAVHPRLQQADLAARLADSGTSTTPRSIARRRRSTTRTTSTS